MMLDRGPGEGPGLGRSEERRVPPEAPASAGATETDPLALYVHWPFCISKCPYCDFNSHVRERIDEAAWRDALIADLRHEAALLPGRMLGSIFFGGGTPSLMAPATVAAIIEEVSKLWYLPSEAEITLEANPSSAEAARFAGAAAAGVNRISLGVQSLDDGALHFLGRAHDARAALAAVATAQATVDRVSIDLIYARPGQTEESWAAELERALALGTDHLSLYQLAIEPGTRFATLVRQGALAPMDADAAAPLFELTRAVTAARGRPAYEVSNHARPGDESRHNLSYWRYGDYVGVGPGAHGRRGGAATLRHKKPESWAAAVGRQGHGIADETPLSPAERAAEALLMGLRLEEGVDLARIAARSGLPRARLLHGRAVDRLVAQGLVAVNADRLTVTAPGMLLLDAILAEIVAA